MSTLNRAIRAEKRKRVLGEAAHCEKCSWHSRSALVKTKEGTRCYECQLLEKSKGTTEAHHHLGRAVDPSTVLIPGNIHRHLSERQRDWDALIRSNSQRDPLLWLAAAIMGIHDHLAWWVDWVERIAVWLVQLSEHLADRDGERWWETLELAPLWADCGST